jgi:hypothetical protein
MRLPVDISVWRRNTGTVHRIARCGLLAAADPLVGRLSSTHAERVRTAQLHHAALGAALLEHLASGAEIPSGSNGSPRLGYISEPRTLSSILLSGTSSLLAEVGQ